MPEQTIAGQPQKQPSTASTQPPMRAMGKKQVFCAQCQSVNEMDVGLDKNNEIVAVCQCGRHLKFPLVEDAAQLDAMLTAHHEANSGQVTVEMAQDAQKIHDEKFMKALGISK